METIQLNASKKTVTGRILAKEIISPNGYFLLRKGMALSKWHLEILLNHDIREIEVEKLSSPDLVDQFRTFPGEKEEVMRLYADNVAEVKRLFEAAVTRETPSVQDFMKPFTGLLHKVLTRTNIFLELYHIKGHDEYTYRHSINVGLLAATISKMLGQTDEEVLELGKAGFFHDIGKMQLSKYLLNKEGKLTEREYEEIKKHPVYGKELLERIDGVSYTIVQGALLHHERLDGSGYPFGLRGGETPFFAQILAVADIYDAISSDRVYREKFSPFRALEELVNEVYKNKLNGQIVFPFVQHVINGYMNCRVLLESGEEGTIVHLPIEEITRPLIAVGEGYLDLRKNRSLKIKDVQLDQQNPVEI
ncbi:HD-GYP domain-containing protein [Alteribacter keqinensis]|uniref:HD-GYP domain-containing protein n=1 Tax=Alteribacter keqinensis TaxID=2483800 RepID=UPI00115C8243|nr:HD-GYP domain-containing protein [Alteribacter keqinensis]